jgi:AcrR family transcriptional regulator
MSEAAARRYSGRSVEEWKAARRERLMAAGVDLFGTDGYQATSIERLCTRAKVSTRHFYQEFANKEAVLLAVYADLIELGIKHTAEALAAAPAEPIGPRLTGAVNAYLETVLSDPRRARISFVEVIGVSPALEQRRLAFRETLIQFIEYEGGAAVGRGEIEDRDFRFAALAFIGAVNVLAYDWTLLDPQPPVEEIEASLVALGAHLLTGPVVAGPR